MKEFLSLWKFGVSSQGMWAKSLIQTFGKPLSSWGGTPWTSLPGGAYRAQWGGFTPRCQGLRLQWFENILMIQPREMIQFDYYFNQVGWEFYKVVLYSLYWKKCLFFCIWSSCLFFFLQCFGGDDDDNDNNKDNDNGNDHDMTIAMAIEMTMTMTMTMKMAMTMTMAHVNGNANANGNDTMFKSLDSLLTIVLDHFKFQAWDLSSMSLAWVSDSEFKHRIRHWSPVDRGLDSYISWNGATQKKFPIAIGPFDIDIVIIDIHDLGFLKAF